MIFKQWKQVLDGTKTQTRRPVKAGEDLIGGDVGQPTRVHSGGHSAATHRMIRPGARFVTGKTYAVQPGRGKKAVGRIRITKIRQERLQDIALHFDDIRAEGVEKEILDVGYTWRMRWVRLWNSSNRKPYRWEDNPDVWVLEFELVEAR